MIGIMEFRVVVTVRFEMEMEMETWREREREGRVIMCLPSRIGRKSQADLPSFRFQFSFTHIYIHSFIRSSNDSLSFVKQPAC